MATEATQYCKSCRKTKDIEFFIKDNKILKQCSVCRERGRIKIINANCPHNKRKSLCSICGGSSICIHKHRKLRCVQCNGSQICPHSKIKDECKRCGDARKITIRNMVQGSKHDDRKRGRYDAENYIDEAFVKQLVDVCNDKCYYCRCELQYVEYQGNLATVERLNNDIGHLKGNCVIACRTCNLTRVGDTLNLL